MDVKVWMQVCRIKGDFTVLYEAKYFAHWFDTAVVLLETSMIKQLCVCLHDQC